MSSTDPVLRVVIPAEFVALVVNDLALVGFNLTHELECSPDIERDEMPVNFGAQMVCGSYITRAIAHMFDHRDDPVIELPVSTLRDMEQRLRGAVSDMERSGEDDRWGAEHTRLAAEMLAEYVERATREPHYTKYAPEMMTAEEEVEDRLTAERVFLIRHAIEEALYPLDEKLSHEPGEADAALAVLEQRAGMLRALLPALREREQRSGAYEEARLRHLAAQAGVA